MATIKDVARAANVSLATVSKYINGGNVRPENSEAIAQAIAQLDYHVNPFARNLKAQRSPAIGILLPDMNAPFYSNVVMALDKVIREAGYHTIISCYGSNHGLERDNLRFLINNCIDGLIYIPEHLSGEEFYELTANCKIPTIQVDRIVQGITSDAVLVDNSDAVFTAISRLIEAGHRRIAIINGPNSVFSAKERLVGYLRALSANDILYDDALVISEQNDFASGYRGFEALMNLQDKPTAIFTTNYNITMGLITAAHERGVVVPDDVAVFGFDCSDICMMMHPPLPVVHQPEQEIGQTAATYLLERMNGFEGDARICRLKCKILPE